MDYSAEFKNLISDKEKARELINGSSYLGTRIEDWEKARMFIGQYINKDGQILDIGCANGFFLLCLPEWSGHTLEPFGIDLNKKPIEEAQKLFASRKENFVQKDIFDISEMPPHFPKKFDIVFWNVWQNWEFKIPEEKKALYESLQLVKPGGRLIMGFYDGSEKSLKQIARIKALGVRLVRAIKNPTGMEILAWVNVPKGRIA